MIKPKLDDPRSSYKFGEEIGRGKFGVVKLANNITDGKQYAAKFVNTSSEERKEVLREISLWSQLNHPKIANMFDSYDLKQQIIIIMELVPGGELFDRIVDAENFYEWGAASYVEQILQGIDYMQSKSIVHLDLKPENIVCVSRWCHDIKIIDFGLAKQLHKGENVITTRGTPEFVAPEVLSYSPISFATDMWSIGVISYILLSGLSPFMGEDDLGTLRNVANGFWDFDDPSFDSVSKEAKDFIESLLKHNPSKRNTVKDCLAHSWMQQDTSKETKISTANLKRFLAKRRWQKSVTAVRAIRRLSLGSCSSPVRKPSIDCKPITPFIEPQKQEKQHLVDSGIDDEEEIKEDLSSKASTQFNGTVRKCSDSSNNGKESSLQPISEMGTNDDVIERSNDNNNNSNSRSRKSSSAKNVKATVAAFEEKERKMSVEGKKRKISFQSMREMMSSPRTDDSSIFMISQSNESEGEFISSEDEENLIIRQEKVDNYYENCMELGSGRFGVVRKVRHLGTGRFYAAKEIEIISSSREDIIREIELLDEIKHPKVVRLFEAFEDGKSFVLILELITGGELFEKLFEEECASEGDVLFFIQQILEAVESLHNRNILHLDLKPENIMLVDDDSADIKIIDFGLARKVEDGKELRMVQGTPAFAAPEIFNNEEVTSASDLWLGGMHPFPGETTTETLFNVTNSHWEFDEDAFIGISNHAKHFITNLLVKDPKSRMTAHQCLRHPWIKDRRRSQLTHPIDTTRLIRFTRSFTRSFQQSIDEEDTALRNTPRRKEAVTDPELSLNRSSIHLSTLQTIDHLGVDDNLTESSFESDMETIDEVDVNQNSDLQLEERYAMLSKDFRNVDLNDPQALTERIHELEAEKTVLARRMVKHHELEADLQTLRKELETSAEAHQRLEENVRLCQSENGSLEDKNSSQLKENGKLEAIQSDLSQQLDLKKQECERLQEKLRDLQEMEEGTGDLHEKLDKLDREKKKKDDRISELEMEILGFSQKQQSHRDEHEHHRFKLEKELKQMQEKETDYLLEIEEIDLKLEAYEEENEKLKKQLEQVTSEFESNSDLLDLMEETQKEKQAIEDKLKEAQASQKELQEDKDAIQEDLEEENNRLIEDLNNAKVDNAKYVMQISELNSLLESSRNTTTKAETELKVMREGLEGEIKAKDKRIKDLIKKQEELLSENDTHAKQSTENAEKGDAIKSDYERKVLDLEQKVQDLRDERRKIEHDSFTRMVASVEKEYEFNRKYTVNVKELEKSKEEMGVLQEHLRIATDKNSELQMDLNRAKTRFEADINVQMIEQEVKLKEKNRQDTELLMRDVKESHERERIAYEDRINEQDNMNLLLRSEINELRQELQKTRAMMQSLANQHTNGTVSQSSTPEMNSNHRTLDNNHRNSIRNDFDEEDALGERELRRIAYKIYDGNWSRLPDALELRGIEFEQLMSSSINNQEKVYRILVLWKNTIRGNRDDMLATLAEALERIKRKDVVRFLKEMGAGVSSGGGGGLKRRFKSLVK